MSTFCEGRGEGRRGEKGTGGRVKRRKRYGWWGGWRADVLAPGPWLRLIEKPVPGSAVAWTMGET